MIKYIENKQLLLNNSNGINNTDNNINNDIYGNNNNNNNFNNFNNNNNNNNNQTNDLNINLNQYQIKKYYLNKINSLKDFNIIKIWKQVTINKEELTWQGFSVKSINCFLLEEGYLKTEKSQDLLNRIKMILAVGKVFSLSIKNCYQLLSNYQNREINDLIYSLFSGNYISRKVQLSGKMLFKLKNLYQRALDEIRHEHSYCQSQFLIKYFSEINDSLSTYEDFIFPTKNEINENVIMFLFNNIIKKNIFNIQFTNTDLNNNFEEIHNPLIDIKFQLYTIPNIIFRIKKSNNDEYNDAYNNNIDSNDQNPHDDDIDESMSKNENDEDGGDINDIYFNFDNHLTIIKNLSKRFKKIGEKQSQSLNFSYSKKFKELNPMLKFINNSLLINEQILLIIETIYQILLDKANFSKNLLNLRTFFNQSLIKFNPNFHFLTCEYIVKLLIDFIFKKINPNNNYLKVVKLNDFNENYDDDENDNDDENDDLKIKNIKPKIWYEIDSFNQNNPKQNLHLKSHLITKLAISVINNPGISITQLIEIMIHLSYSEIYSLLIHLEKMNYIKIKSCFIQENPFYKKNNNEELYIIPRIKIFKIFKNYQKSGWDSNPTYK